MENKQLAEVLQQGLQDEMNSAFQYIALAGKHGDVAIKQAFLRYASEELQHAQKLLGMLEQQQVEVGEIPLTLENLDELYLYLIEYMAHEESAIFYYEALEQLVQQPEVARLCQEVRGEEQLHLRQMRELYQQVKEGTRHDG